MKKAMVVRNLIITVLSLVIVAICGMIIVDNVNKDNASNRVRLLSDIYAQELKNSTIADTVKLEDDIADNVRLTVVALTGQVVADSYKISGENHLEREEIKSALTGSPKVVLRYSATSRADMLYYAVKVTMPTETVILRVAIPIADISKYYYNALIVFGIVLALVIVANVIVSQYVHKTVMEPLDSVLESVKALTTNTYKPVNEHTKYEEINSIMRGVNDVQVKLVNTNFELERAKAKLENILGSMQEGIVVVSGENNQILLFNNKAQEIFDCNSDVTGKDIGYLISDTTLIDRIGESVATKRGKTSEVELSGKCYMVTISQLADFAFTIVLTDITEGKRAEQMRRKFFENASHELKTPLTSIKGFAELLTANKDELAVKYSSQILKDTERLLVLLNDMLELSELEQSPASANERVSLQKVANEVAESLKAKGEGKNVFISVSGDATVMGDSKRIYELMLNLVDNGIKYNTEKGVVNITLSQKSKFASIKVVDDGIGIEAKHIPHVCERFYCVEKSRSKAAGGTGLGLAIVKHIVENFGYTLKIDSKLGVGTTITIGDIPLASEENK